MKLEVGKRYRNGVGEVIRIEEYDAREARPYAGDDGTRYLSDGRVDASGMASMSRWNLVSEVPDDPDPRWEALLVVLRELTKDNGDARHAICLLEQALDKEGTRPYDAPSYGYNVQP